MPRYKTFDETLGRVPLLTAGPARQRGEESPERRARPMVGDAYPDGPPPGLNAAEMQSLKEELRGKIEAVESIEVEHQITSDPSRTRNHVLAKIPDPWKKAVQAYLETRPTYTATTTMEYEFARFAERETQITGQPMSELVAPTGDFSGVTRLFLQLHYPTFFTKHKDWSHTADTSNPCTKFLLKKGLNPLTQPMCQGEVYWRRTSTKGRKLNAVKFHGNPEEAEHDRFTMTCHRMVNPLVVLCFGRWAQAKFLNVHYAKSQPELGHKKLPLTCPDRERAGNRKLQLHIMTYKNIVTCIMVECPHPEAIFHEGLGIGYYMDQCIRVAVELAGLKVPLNDNYFEHVQAERRELASGGFSCAPWEDFPHALSKMLKFENEIRESESDMPKIPYEHIPRRLKEMFNKWTGLPVDKAIMEEHLLPLCPEWHVSLVKGLHVLMCSQVKKVPEQKSEPKQYEDPQLRCDIADCDQGPFNTRQALSLHKQVAHQGKRWYCQWPGCNHPYRSSGSLSKHIKNVHNGEKKPVRRVPNVNG